MSDRNEYVIACTAPSELFSEDYNDVPEKLKARNPVGLACTFRSVPMVGAECYSSVWSQGRECKYCPIDCYRAGHDKDWVDEDNERMVREKLASLAEENTP